MRTTLVPVSYTHLDVYKRQILKYSVIIPVYNVEKYIDRCLKSIISQNYDDLEIIVVDNGSTDSSGSICDIYANEHSNISVYHIENMAEQEVSEKRFLDMPPRAKVIDKMEKKKSHLYLYEMEQG